MLMHIIGLSMALGGKFGQFGSIMGNTVSDFKESAVGVGGIGRIRCACADSQGLQPWRRDFTGIEAVSNGVTILREPRVKTAKRVMLYMAISLSVLVLGLMFAYLMYEVQPESTRTLTPFFSPRYSVYRVSAISSC